jgi:hypothetical protein
VAVIYLYADETGNLDYNAFGTPTESGYFGFGTTMFRDDHGDVLWKGHELRTRLAAAGLQVTGGFHAIKDTIATRNEMFETIKELAPRIDTTFLYKPNAYDYVKARGQMHLYKMAWYLHIKEVAIRVSNPSDKLVIVAGSFGTKERAKQAHEAIQDVCGQISRSVTLCIWDASTSWGLQIADYALWSVHRHLVGKGGTWFTECIQPSLSTMFFPWRKAP